MSYLTKIEHTVETGETLSRDDLIFLFETERSIEGFGHYRDPRIEELQATRQGKEKEDTPILFNCRPDEIAWSPEEINDNTKAYIGPLFPHIFGRLQHLDHIYTSFLEGKIVIEDLEIGGESKEELKKRMNDHNVEIIDFAQEMIDHPDFTTLPKHQVIKTVRLNVRDLGFSSGATLNQILDEGIDFDLERLPDEGGIKWRLAHMNQPNDDVLYMVMKTFFDRNGYPGVFQASRRGDRRRLRNRLANPDNQWFPDYSILFSLRPSTKA